MTAQLAAKKLKKKFSVFILNQKHTIFSVSENGSTFFILQEFT